MSYATLKAIHFLTVAATAGLFLGRSMAQLAGIDWRRWRLLRILPHLIDTVLLVSAVWLAVLAGLAPWEHSWLAAKIIGLVVYVLLGLQALKPASSRGRRLAFTVAAVGVFAYVIAVALSKNPWPLG